MQQKDLNGKGVGMEGEKLENGTGTGGGERGGLGNNT